MRYKNFDKKIHDLDGEEVTCAYCGETLELTLEEQRGSHMIHNIAACDCTDITSYLAVESQIEDLRGQIVTLEATKPVKNTAIANQKKYDKELARLKKKYNIED